jgi:uncharacterized protein
MYINEIVNITVRQGFVNICLFASTLRGQDTPSGDNDCLLDLKEDGTLFNLIRLKNELEGLLKRPVDVISSKSLYWMTKEQIIGEAVHYEE